MMKIVDTTEVQASLAVFAVFENVYPKTANNEKYTDKQWKTSTYKIDVWPMHSESV